MVRPSIPLFTYKVHYGAGEQIGLKKVMENSPKIDYESRYISSQRWRGA